jgi:translocation and assembly module TamB
MAKRRLQRWRPRKDWGRIFALVLSAIFAVIGAVPLGLGLLVRTDPVRAWAARETAALVAEKLGVSARYEVRVQAWPMMIALERVVVDASDGPAPFLEVERVALRPRPFSLLAGQLDVGEVEVIGPRVRAVVEKGELKNLLYDREKLAKLSDPKAKSSRAPLASLAVTDARVDATIDGTRVSAREIDVDVSAEEDTAFEIALRAGETAVTRVHPLLGREAYEDAVDDDVICRLEARVRVQGRSLLVRRLLLAGSADFDPDPGTRPSCQLRDDDWRAVELRLGAVRIDVPEKGKPLASGRVHARVPAPLAHRLVDIAHVTGSVTLDLEVEYDGIAPLPRLTGHVSGIEPGLDGKVFARRFDLDVVTSGGTVRVSKLVAHWGDGKVTIPEVTIEPFVKGIPLNAGPVTIEGIEFPGLLRDLGAHPQAHVAWTLEKGRLDYFRGHLDPPLLQGPIMVSTRNFEIFNRPTVDPLRGHMMGVKEGVVRGTFIVNGQARSAYKMPGVVLQNFSIDTPRSHLATTVTLGFDTTLDIEVHEGSRIDLAEISPLGADLTLAGVASLKVNGHGPFEHPRIAGELKIADFVFAGLPVGDLESPRVAFEPLVLDLFDARIRHGRSLVRAPAVRLAFDKGAAVIADADIDTREAPGLRVRDLFEVFHFDKDPRFADIAGVASGKGRVHYALGGKEDTCGGGVLHVETSMDLAEVSLIGERFDGGSLDVDVLWDDQPAGTAGMRIDLRSATLRKGEGSILLGASVRRGGFVKGNLIGNGIPVSKLDMLGSSGKLFDGTASLVGELGGTLSALEASADVNLSRVRIGPSSLGPSHFRLALGSNASGARAGPVPRCSGVRGKPFDPVEYERDYSDGDIRLDGALFDGQVALDDVRITRQRHKVLSGKVSARSLDLGTLANLVPGVAFTSAPPRGALTATLAVKSFPFDAPQRASMALTLDALDVEREGSSLKLADKSGPIELAADVLKVPDLRVQVRSASGLKATVVAGGTVRRATTGADLELGVRLEPVDLTRLSADIPSVERASGTLDASLRVSGPVSALRYAGALELRKGELELKGVPIGLSDMNVDVEIGGGDARIKTATARLGGGTVQVTGRMPLRGPEAGALSAAIAARGVKLPIADGVNLTADAQLEASYKPGSTNGQRNVPDVKGTVELTSFRYTRPIALNLSLSQLGRAPRTSVDTYDPASDVVRFSVNLVSPRPLRFRNNLMDMDLEVMSPGLVLSGTNQRYGARGQLRILPDSKLVLRSNEFVVREGFVRFEDPLKIAPKVDVRAQTEYRRYASGGPEQPAAAASPDSGGTSGAPASPASSTAGTSGGGLWRITLQAHGDADNLKVTLSSDPALSQEDIVLLLTIGMTRAEIDRGAASALGETVGLEALSALTGADKAVKTVVPIDEFRFGTGYSSKTGRTEPTVTVGKRITDNVRATVTTGVSEDRQVRSNVEWRLNRQVSVQGSYDNLNDVSGSPIGNIGVDLRWRLEFE